MQRRQRRSDSSSTNTGRRRQSSRIFETNFLKYLSIYDGIVRDTIEEQEMELASAVFEDQIQLVPTTTTTIVSLDNNNNNNNTDKTVVVVGMEELKRMMKGYLQAGTRFELLEVHQLKTCRNPRNNRRAGDTNGSSSMSAPPAATTPIILQYSARMIQANGDSEIGTTRIMLSDTGRIASVMDTPTTPSSSSKNKNKATTTIVVSKKEEEEEKDDTTTTTTTISGSCRSESNNNDNAMEFRIVGCFGRTSKGTSTTFLQTPVFQSL